MKKIISLLMVLILVLFLVACGSDNNNAGNADENDSGYKNATTDTEMTAEARDGDFGGLEFTEEESKGRDDSIAPTSSPVDQRKIIKSASMEVETLEFDKAITLLQNKVDLIGGYIESSNIRGTSLYDDYSTRSANFRLRIPAKEFMKFMLDMNTIGNIINESTHGDDITSEYYDTDAHLKTLRIQEDRLLNILRKAEIIEDIITLERELSNVRYQIESMTGTLRRWDNLVDYATLNIAIYEVYEITEEEVHPETLWERISQKFKNSTSAVREFFEDSTVFALGTVPFLIFWIPGILILVLVLKKLYKKEKHRIPFVKKDEDVTKK